MTAATGEIRLIAGRYRLESLIGEGGSAAVWRAVDTTLERRVAVKLLYARDERHHAQRIVRFKREARIAAAVQHPNVVGIVDFGTTQQEVPYMVMEMLHGTSLNARLKSGPRPSLEETVRIAASTLRGLDAVHAAGIVHRDIKPENVFLHQDGERVVPKILDFGISSLVHPDGQRLSAQTTRVGVLFGTPEYMSPEQCRGSTLDLRTDIYSMGVLLYEALSGRPPFEAENIGDLLVAIVTSNAPPLRELAPDLPEPLSEVVQKAMARKPEQRFASAAEMREALLAALDLGPTPSDMPPLGINESALRAAVRIPLLAALSPVREDDADVDVDVLEPHAATQPVKAAQTESMRVIATPARRFRRWPLLAAATAVAAIALWLARGSSTDAARAVSREAQAELPARAVPIPAADAPAATPPATITVELRGLPDHATVTVDGEVSLQAPLQLARDGRDRLIRVSARGKAPWQVVHRASADGAYEVALVRAEATRGAATPRSRSRKQAAARPGAQVEPPQALQRLDF